MAATVIDSFVVELGLDPTKFDAQQKKVVSSFKKNQDDLESRAQNVDKAVSNTAVSLGAMARQAGGFLAAVGGGKFLVDFATQAVGAAAATNRLTNTISTNVGTLSKWQGVARVFGGDAGAMASSFTQLSDAFAGWKIGDVSPLISTFRAISTAGGVTIDMNKGVEQSLLDLAENFKNIAAGPGGKEQVGLLGRKLGLDPATISLMMQGSARLKEELSKIQALTKDNAEAADQLDQRWNALTLKLQRWGQDSILKLAPKMEETLATDAQDIHTIMTLWDKIVNWKNGKGFVASPDAPAAPSPSPYASGASGSTGSFRNPDGSVKDPARLDAFIRKTAIEEKIDPNYARRVAGTEGFNNFYSGIPGEKSYGAFQLNRSKDPRGTSLGDKFLKDTGLDPSDPNNEAAGIKYALHHAATSGRGWADWYGARNNGIGQFAGIGQGGGNTTTTIENLNVNVPAGSDGAKIAADVQAALASRTSRAAQANSGPGG